MADVELTEPQRDLLERVYQWRVTHQRWPSMTEMALPMDREGLDLEAIVDEIPEEALLRPRFVGARGNGTLSLTFEGLLAIPSGREDVALLAHGIRTLYELSMSLPPETLTDQNPATIKAGEVREQLERNGQKVDDDALRKLFWLLNDYGRVLRGGGSDASGLDWSVMPDMWELRRYRNVTTVDDFLKERQAELERQRQQLATPFRATDVSGTETTQAPVEVQEAEAAAQPSGLVLQEPPVPSNQVEPAPTPFVDERYVFVLMPFRAEWSDRTYGWMVEVFKELSANYPGLHWRRADELIRQGQIAQQIRSEIVRAKIIVADITGSNPNVLYELGFADGKEKDPIILNQDPEASPFDLAAQRQLKYGVDNEHHFRENFKKWMRMALGSPDPPSFAPPLNDD